MTPVPSERETREIDEDDEFHETWDERAMREIIPALAILQRYQASGCSWWIGGDGHTGYEAGCTTDQGRHEGHDRESLYRAVKMADNAASSAIGRARVRDFEALRADAALVQELCEALEASAAVSHEPRRGELRALVNRAAALRARGVEVSRDE